MYHVGCDQHKKYSFVVAKDEQGSTVEQVKLYHSEREKLRAYFFGLPKGSVVALESCGFDHWLGDLIEEAGIGVKLSHPARTKAIAEERVKTDKISANVLADLLRAQLLPQAYRAPRPVRDARALMRYRLKLVTIRSTFKNCIHSIIAFQGIEFTATDLFGKKGRSFLEQIELAEPYRQIITNYLRMIDELSELISKVDGQLRRNLRFDERARRLTTIPGIGVISAHMIVAEIGDIRRFRSSAKLARYVGLVPSVHQSGQSLYHGRITKQGNKYLRTSFVEAAQTAVRHDPYLQRCYQKLKVKKGHNVAVVAVAHKLVKSAYVILSRQCDYRYRTLMHG